MTMWLLLILTLLLCGQVRQVTARRTVLEHIHRLVSLHDVSTEVFFMSFSLYLSPFLLYYIPPIHSFVRSFIHSFIYSFIHSFIYSFIHLYIHSFIHSSVRSFDRSFVRSFINLVCKFINSFIPSFDS